jgi:hypothetical protein
MKLVPIRTKNSYPIKKTLATPGSMSNLQTIRKRYNRKTEQKERQTRTQIASFVFDALTFCVCL